MTLANKITLIRIGLIPFFVIFMMLPIPYSHWVAAIIFIIASVTDGVDGYIARTRNQITNFGKFLDPLADKLLISAALVMLVAVGKVAPWIVIVIISREFAITGMRTVAVAAGLVVAASPLGKIKTVSQIIAIVFLLFSGMTGTAFLLGQIFMYIALFFTIYSGVDYFYRNRNIFKGEI